MGPRLALNRRRWLGGAAALMAGGCTRRAPPGSFAAAWVDAASPERGHALRDGHGVAVAMQPDARRCAVAVIGAGIAGLAAARALRHAGIDDLAVFDLGDEAGGNSRGHHLAGAACPLGAHYLPLPGPRAHEVAAWLDEIGLRRLLHGRAVYDERHLCHSPQERLWVDGEWVDGLLPPAAPGSATQAQARHFAARVRAAQRELGFAIPTWRAPFGDAHRRLDAQRFADWLDREALTDARLRWYLDYCCHDEYGASAQQVSAWAGLHYFASRHGFHAPGDGDDDARDAVLTWPEGNAWLVQRLAAGLDQRLHTAAAVQRVAPLRHGVEVDVHHARTARRERWRAQQVVLAVPLFVAARLLDPAPAALREAAAAVPSAPWLVANLLIDAPLTDKPGAAPSWDNVLYTPAPPAGAVDPSGDARLQRGALGYVDAGHQRLDAPAGGPTVLTAYWALGGDHAADAAQARQLLLHDGADRWARRVVAHLSRAHPDLPRKLQRVDLMRYGHAMATPVPGLRGLPALAALRDGAADVSSRVHFAHADLAGYSVFEEAFSLGHAAGARAARRLGQAGG
jgi:predicted NAD/FAD-dependent oxidoreductase